MRRAVCRLPQWNWYSRRQRTVCTTVHMGDYGAAWSRVLVIYSVLMHGCATRAVVVQSDGN